MACDEGLDVLVRDRVGCQSIQTQHKRPSHRNVRLDGKSAFTARRQYLDSENAPRGTYKAFRTLCISSCHSSKACWCSFPPDIGIADTSRRACARSVSFARASASAAVSGA